MSILGSVPDFDDAAKKLATNLAKHGTTISGAAALIERALTLTFVTGVKWGATAMKESDNLKGIYDEANFLANREKSDG
jgi:hypothetical protein